jgi:hypothetical protein
MKEQDNFNGLNEEKLTQLKSYLHFRPPISSEKIEMIKPPHELQTRFAQIVEKTEATKTQYQQSK